MNGEPTIRPLLPGDLDELCLFQSGLHGRLRTSPSLTRSFYEWKFFGRSHPSGLPSCHGAFLDGRLQAVLGTLPFDLRNGPDHTPCGWICDWYVAHRARGSGLGRRLLAAAAERFPTLACINGSDEAQDIYRAQGFRSAPVGRDLRWLARPFHYEWKRRKGLRKIEALFKFWKHARPAGRASASWKPLDKKAPQIYPAEASTPGMERSPELIAWFMRSPVAELEIWHSPEGHALVALDDDWRGLRRARILDTTATHPEAWSALARTLGMERNLDYIDAIGPLSLAGTLAGQGWIPGHERTVWLRGAGTESFPLDRWHIGLMDKDNAFRYGKWVP